MPTDTSIFLLTFFSTLGCRIFLLLAQFRCNYSSLQVHKILPNTGEYSNRVDILCKFPFFSQITYLLLLKAQYFAEEERKISDLKIKSNQISLFLTQLQLQQNELKLNTQNAQLKAGKKN